MDVNDQKPRNTIEDMRSIYSTIENKLITLLNTEMYSNLSKSAEEWKSVQLGLIKRSQVNNKISNYLSNVARGLKLANSNVSNSLNINTKALEKESKNALKLLAVSGKNYYKQSVNKTYSLAKTKDLKYAILEQAKEGFDKGLAVPTKSGRLYEYKGYMEMRTRTAISTEITNQQLEVNKIAKNVFFICSSFEDCAEDHADYQGKVYYDERFVNFGFDKERLAQIEKAIRSNKMLSIQQVMNNKPYLTTRPNCRHRFVPITLEQALGNTTSLLKKLHLYTGKYDDKKYKMSQDLRYCERNIRAYKDMAENFATMGLKQPNQSVEAMTKYYTKLAEEWQLRARGLVKMAKNNGYDLERDYERETRKTIIQDLGAKYFDNPFKKVIKSKEENTPPQTPPTEVIQEDPLKTRKIINGEKISGDWKELYQKQFNISVDEYVATEHKEPINCLIQLQQFNRLPRVVGKKDFEELYKESGFFSKRVISTKEKDIAFAYDDMLKNGEFYVDCAGGNVYGNGCYCAGNFDIDKEFYKFGFDDEAREKIDDEVRRYAESADYNECYHHIYETITLDKSAKIINYDNIAEEYGLYKLEEYKKQHKALSIKGKEIPITQEVIKSAEKYIKYARSKNEAQYKMIIADRNYDETEIEINKEKLQELNKEFQSINSEVDENGLSPYDYYMRLVNIIDNDNKDAGSVAVMLGYDAIRVTRRTEATDYAVILNRSKMIILDEPEYEED